MFKDIRICSRSLRKQPTLQNSSKGKNKGSEMIWGREMEGEKTGTGRNQEK